MTRNSSKAAARSNLTSSSEIALRAILSGLTAGRYTIALDECQRHIRARYPVLGAIVEPSDIQRQMQHLRFLRDRGQPGVAWRHESRSDRHSDYDRLAGGAR